MSEIAQPTPSRVTLALHVRLHCATRSPGAMVPALDVYGAAAHGAAK